MAVENGGGSGGSSAATKTSSIPAGVAGSSIVGFAREQEGDPYDFGANGPNAWDCSSLVQYAYRRAGIDIPRVTYDQVKMPNAQAVGLDQLQPGDLVFSDWGDGPNSHVALYAGDGQLFEAGTANGVAYTPFGPNYKAHVTAVRRPAGVQGYNGTAAPVSIDPIIPTPGDAIEWAIKTGAGLLAGATDPLGALNRIGDAIAGMASGVLKFGQVQGKILDFMLSPRRMILKATLFFFGIIFIIIGIWFISRELKD